MSQTVLAAVQAVDVLNQSLPALHPPAAGGDIFSWATNLAGDAKSALTAVGGTLAVGFAIYIAIKAKGALTGIVTGAVVAIFFIWVLHNISADEVQSKVKNTINGLGPVVTQTHTPARHGEI